MSAASIDRRSTAYPALLRELTDAPSHLYLRKGEPELLSRPSVAIVGARSCSAYGAQVARMLGRELAGAGLVVVSGLARGIDGEAHRGALAAGGVTVAVLGCGVDRDYPARHAELAARIVEAGEIVSEYEPGVEPAPWRFPARKRKGQEPCGVRGTMRAVPAVAAAKCCGRGVSVVSRADGRWTVPRSLDAS